MGLSSFPTSSDGVLPVIVMNSVMSMTLLKNTVCSVLRIMNGIIFSMEASRERRVSITRFGSLRRDRFSGDKSGFWSKQSGGLECCVCLSGFEAHEEVSELSCKHFFHKGCLDTWFGNNHATCPLCRSVN